VRKAAVVALLIVAGLTAYASGRAETSLDDLEPSLYLPRSHSHNDYAQSRPLVDALRRGFASVEVDVFLVDGALLVAHEADEVSPSVTLRGLYLDPLRAIVSRNGGSAYSDSNQPLQLLVDVKSEAGPTYRALHETLQDYTDILTSWTNTGAGPGPVVVVLSGNRATRLVESEPVRYVALDGRAEEDRSAMTADVMPLVSVDWESVEAQSENERLAAARSLVERFHAEGRKVRFWGTPDRAALWRSLVAMGVDYIGTDDPRRLQRLLQEVGDLPASAVEE